MKQKSKLIRIHAFDNLEMLSMKEQQHDFPEHYHETYCISFLESGCEQIRTNGQTTIGTSGGITINNPYEIHSNPLMDGEINLSFKTIYPSQELIKFYNHNQLAFFKNTPIFDPSLSYCFQIVAGMFNKSTDYSPAYQEEFQQLLQSFFQRLLRYQSHGFTTKQEDFSPLQLEEIKFFIKTNLTKKITLKDLAGIYNTDIYSFSKKFKAISGISPINYTLLLKILEAKKRLCQKERISDIVYDLGFYDQAHFSNTFKKYMGISPKSYLQPTY